jgi:chromosomal replication initiator protein
MNNIEIEKYWKKALEYLEPELTPVSFQTWISTLTPVSVDEDKGTLSLLLSDGIAKNILEDRYRTVIEGAVKMAFGFSLRVVFLFPDELDDRRNIMDDTIPDYTDELYLNPKYTFSTFVIGSNNRFAHAASLAVAESPSKAYNPLFIYGGAGLGKTHLMHAIGHYILQNDPDKKVLYVSSEMFTNELIKSIRENKTIEFRKKYRNIDILLIDDIQFIEKKESVQEEIFHTFNTLHEVNKQIIISSDRPPKEIATLEDRLRSRFEWGLIADIQPPDFETRVAILCKKAELEGIMITEDFMGVIHEIAERIQYNIRELEGAFIRVVAYATLTGQSINKDLAREALKDVFANSPKNVTPSDIKSHVCKHFNIKVSDMESAKRSRDLAFPRQIAMYLCRKMTELSLPKIGEHFGNRDHTTVLHACDKISREVKTNETLKGIVNDLEMTLKNN